MPVDLWRRLFKSAPSSPAARSRRLPVAHFADSPRRWLGCTISGYRARTRAPIESVM